MVERTIKDYQIDCEYSKSGHISVAFKPSHLRHLEAEARVLAEDFRLKVQLLDRDALTDEVGSAAYHGGLLVEESGGLHPAKYFAGLCKIASAIGAQLHSDCGVTAIESDGKGFAVTVTGRKIPTRDVLVATNGSTDGVLPGLRRR